MSTALVAARAPGPVLGCDARGCRFDNPPDGLQGGGGGAVLGGKLKAPERS